MHFVRFYINKAMRIKQVSIGKIALLGSGLGQVMWAIIHTNGIRSA